MPGDGRCQRLIGYDHLCFADITMRAECLDPSPMAASKLGSLVTSWTNLWSSALMGVLCAAALLSKLRVLRYQILTISPRDRQRRCGGSHGYRSRWRRRNHDSGQMPPQAAGEAAIGGPAEPRAVAQGAPRAEPLDRTCGPMDRARGASGSGGSNADEGVRGEQCDRTDGSSVGSASGSSGATGTGGSTSGDASGRRRRRRNGWKRRR